MDNGNGGVNGNNAVNEPMEKYQNKYRIPSTRMQNWDYGWAGSYFITICTRDREHYFGNVVDGKMKLSEIGIIADILWHEIKNHGKNVELGEFVVMPNHIHGIVILNEPVNNNGNNNGNDNGNDNDNDDNNDNDGGNDNGNDNGNNGGNNDGNDNNDEIVETTHALSLPNPLIVPNPLSVPNPLIAPNSLSVPNPLIAPNSLSVPNPLPESNSLSVHHSLSVPNTLPESIPLTVPDPLSNPHVLSIQSTQPAGKTIGQKRFQHQGKNTLSAIAGSYKSAVSKHAHRLGMEFGWQPRFHDHLIQDDSEYRRISQYILNNPAKWKKRI